MLEVRVDGKNIQNTKYASLKILLDTNILVFAHNRNSSEHSKASCVLVAALQGDLRGYTSSQNLFELYSVLTNPSKVRPPMDAPSASRICSDLLSSERLRKVFPNENSTREIFELAERKGLRKSQIFDCLLAITARRSGIDQIWTGNVADFKHLEFIKVENPLEMKWELIEPEEKRQI